MRFVYANSSVHCANPNNWILLWSTSPMRYCARTTSPPLFTITPAPIKLSFSSPAHPPCLWKAAYRKVPLLPAFAWIIEIGKYVSLSTGRGEYYSVQVKGQQESFARWKRRRVTSFPGLFFLQVWRAHVLPPNNFYSRSRPSPGRVAMVSKGGETARSEGPGSRVWERDFESGSWLQYWQVAAG